MQDAKPVKTEDINQDEPDEAVLAAVDRAADHLQGLKGEIGAHIFGQDGVIEQVLVTLLAGGHGLLVGVPGLAKTMLVNTIGAAAGLTTRRVQFTPDLLPSDIIGSEVLEDSGGKRNFRFIEGPVFSQLLMADEINRASPRTQSALLQAMQEHTVTVSGETRSLPEPFHVLATQNPIEQEGTYPLPEAQLDRFFMQINVDYPSEEAERRILIETTGAKPDTVKAVMNADQLMQAQKIVRDIPVGESVVTAILALVRSLRPEGADSDIVWGPGPRAAQALMLAVKARALLLGRYTPTLDDVAVAAPPVLRHRMALSFTAMAEGEGLDTLILEKVEAL